MTIASPAITLQVTDHNKVLEPFRRLNNTEVREWAKAQGIEGKDRGRAPAKLVVKFKAATEQ